MTDSQQPNWQPITFLPTLVQWIDDALADTEEQYATFSAVRSKPHVLDDEIIERTVRLYTEQLQFLRLYRQQLDRWKQSHPSAQQKQTIYALNQKITRCKELSQSILDLIEEIRQGTINRILEMDDAELALKVLSGELKMPGHE